MNIKMTYCILSKKKMTYRTSFINKLTNFNLLALKLYIVVDWLHAPPHTGSCFNNEDE